MICPDPWKSGARNTVGEQDFKLGGAILVDGWGYIPILVLSDNSLCLRVGGIHQNNNYVYVMVYRF